jgi:hypothetical protein
MEIEDAPLIVFRMEEEEEVDEEQRQMGFISEPRKPGGKRSAEKTLDNAVIHELLTQLMAERQSILSEEKLTPRQKLALLETNRKALVIARGGSVRKTENVVYSILIFSSIVLVILASLTAFAQLPQEVTLAFVGTVVGGTISIIAQKLGKM